jgi:hypothetical protein
MRCDLVLEPLQRGALELESMLAGRKIIVRYVFPILDDGLREHKTKLINIRMQRPGTSFHV